MFKIDFLINLVFYLPPNYSSEMSVSAACAEFDSASHASIDLTDNDDEIFDLVDDDDELFDLMDEFCHDDDDDNEDAFNEAEDFDEIACYKMLSRGSGLDFINPDTGAPIVLRQRVEEPQVAASCAVAKKHAKHAKPQRSADSSQAVVQIVKCKFGEKCKYQTTTCKLSHPKPQTVDSPQAVVQIVKCKFGEKCKYQTTTCKLSHPEPQTADSSHAVAKKIDRACKFGPSCRFLKKGECTFTIHE